MLNVASATFTLFWLVLYFGYGRGVKRRNENN